METTVVVVVVVVTFFLVFIIVKCIVSGDVLLFLRIRILIGPGKYPAFN